MLGTLPHSLARSLPPLLPVGACRLETQGSMLLPPPESKAQGAGGTGWSVVIHALDLTGRAVQGVPQDARVGVKHQCPPFGLAALPRAQFGAVVGLKGCL